MGKWFGKIGFATSETIATDVYTEVITERDYYGDVNRINRRLQTADKINDDLSISNTISIIADPFASNNLYSMRYVIYMGTKWKITDADVQYPRINLTLGGLYTEEVTVNAQSNGNE